MITILHFITGIADPFTGSLGEDFQYEGSALQYEYSLALKAYTLAGYDLVNDIAIPGINNPMT
jgi:hypothetical protein